MTVSCQEETCRYSITSSARATSVAGISMPSSFAVLRLMNSSNLVGCSTGTADRHFRLRQLAAANEIRRLVRDHHGRGIEIGRDHPRHNGGIDHAQVLQSMRAQLVIDKRPCA